MCKAERDIGEGMIDVGGKALRVSSVGRNYDTVRHRVIILPRGMKLRIACKLSITRKRERETIYKLEIWHNYRSKIITHASNRILFGIVDRGNFSLARENDWKFSRMTVIRLTRLISRGVIANFHMTSLRKDPPGLKR